MTGMVHKSLRLNLGQSFEHITLYTYVQWGSHFFWSHPYIWSTTILHNNVWYEGGVTEEQNVYHRDPWEKTKIFNLGFPFCEELWPKQNYLHFIWLFMGPLQGTRSKWYLWQFLWHTKSQKSGQIYQTVLPRKAYYSCQVSTICVASV